MITFATIGTSVITERFAEAVAEAEGTRIGVVSSRDAERGRAFAERIGAPASVDGPIAALAGEVDAVYIGSPNGLHAAQAREAIDAGLHVFVEKPATPTAAEFAALIEAAHARGVVIFEGMRNVYDPGLVRVRELLPRLGTIRRASFALNQRSARYDLVLRGETPNIFDPALAGGALFDLGVYPLSAAVSLFGEPSRVTGALSRIATGADGAGAALLTYPDLVVDIGFSKITASARPSEIQGELGTLTIDRITDPRLLVLTPLGGEPEEFAIDAAENNMRYEVERFAQLVSGADTAAADQARSLAVLRIVESLRAPLGA